MATILAAAMMTIVMAVAAPRARAGDAARPAGAPAASHGCLPVHDGYLRARVRGARTLNLDWRGTELECDGDPRAKHGFRMTFAGPLASTPDPGGGPGAHRLRLVFGIDAPARAGKSREVAVNVTLIFEGERRIYSTGGAAQCTLDRLTIMPLRRVAPQHSPAAAHSARSPRLLRVQARGFCVGPASRLGGPGAGEADQLVLSRFDFAGALHIATP